MRERLRPQGALLFELEGGQPGRSPAISRGITRFAQGHHPEI